MESQEQQPFAASNETIGLSEPSSAPAAPSVSEPNGPADHQQPPIQDSNANVPMQGALADGNALFPIPGIGMSVPGMETMQSGIGMNGVVSQEVTNGNNSKYNNNMSADEIALYDRQIRLWGMKAQKKIQAANILLITMKALSNEIAKNLVLAGIGSLTLVDDQLVNEADLGAQFFLSEDQLGQNRAQAACEQVQKLNPRVSVFADAGSIMTKGPSYFSAFDLVIATDESPTTLAFINTATRLYGRQFYAAGTHGLYGYIFSDLIEHDFVLQRDKSNKATAVGPETRTRSIVDVKTQKEGDKVTELVAKRELYSTWDLASIASALPSEYTQSKRRLKAVTPALSCLRALWGFQTAFSRSPGHNRQDLEAWTKAATEHHKILSLPSETLRSDFLRSFLQNVGSEVAPVSAILGGQLAQDVINVLGQSQQPIQNMVIFDGNKMEAQMFPLHPEGLLGRAQLELQLPTMPPMGDQQMGMMNQLPTMPDMPLIDQTQAIDQANHSIQIPMNPAPTGHEPAVDQSSVNQTVPSDQEPAVDQSSVNQPAPTSSASMVADQVPDEPQNPQIGNSVTAATSESS